MIYDKYTSPKSRIPPPLIEEGVSFGAMLMNSVDDGEEFIEKFTEKVNDLQKVIDDNAEDIMRITKRMAHLSEDASDKELAEKAMSYGLDCGFSYFFFKDPEDAELAKTVSRYDCAKSDHSGRFSVRLPFGTQSTTLQSYENTAIVKFAEESGINVGFSIRLD